MESLTLDTGGELNSAGLLVRGRCATMVIGLELA